MNVHAGVVKDCGLLDVLELCGTTVQARRLVGPGHEDSRRYRILSKDFGLVRDRRQLWGCGYGTSASMRLLRLGCRAHRLAAGVARIGSDLLHHRLVEGCPWRWGSAPRHRSWWVPCRRCWCPIGVWRPVCDGSCESWG